MNPDDPRRQDPPEPVSELLATLRAQRGWQRRLEGARVHEHWAEIVGPQLAEHTEAVRLHGGVLVVRARTPAWATQVRYLAGAVQERANAVLGPGQVTQVVVVAGPASGGREGG